MVTGIQTEVKDVNRSGNSGHIVFMLANEMKSELQVGVTSCGSVSNLESILNSNSNGRSGNSSKFLVYYELLDDQNIAEKWVDRLKQYSIKKKNSLVDYFNPEWKNLAEHLDQKLNKNI